MSEAHERVVLDVRNSSFTSSVHIDADTSMSVATLKERISEYVRTQHCAHDGWPQASGIRCIYRGSILSNDTKLDTLHNEGAPIPIHAVVQPDAWTRWPEPEAQNESHAGPSKTHPGEAPNDSAQPAPYSGEHSYTPLAALQAMPPSDHASLLSAVYLTLEAYHAYYLQLCECLHRERRMIEPVPLHTPKEIEADLRVQAVELIESRIMRWASLRSECEKACEEASYKYEPHYERVVLHGLPFVLCTTKRVALHAETHLLPELESRLRALLSLYLQFFAHCMEHGTQAQTDDAPSQSVPLRTHVDQEDWISLGLFLLGLCWRVGLALLFFAPDSLFEYPVLLTLAVIGFLVAASVWHMHSRMRQRVPEAARDRGQSHSEVPRASSAPLTVPASAPSTRTLEIPLLPQRIPTVAPSRWEYWFQRIAWTGLQQEEEAMGFTHVPPSEPLRITWQACAWPPHERMRRPRPLPPRSWVHAMMTLVGMYCMTLEPEIDKLRADAIRLREDAICALARKWNALQEEDESLKHAVPPILTHPYARRVLIQEAKRSVSA